MIGGFFQPTEIAPLLILLQLLLLPFQLLPLLQGLRSYFESGMGGGGGGGAD